MKPFVFLFLCIAGPAAAQNTATQNTPDLPTAPAAPTKPTFTLPRSITGSQVLTPANPGPPPVTPDTPEYCSAPAEGIYGPQPALTPDVKKAIDTYFSQSSHRLDIAWVHRMPRALNDPWVRAASVTVRFAILPSGAIDTPVITISSGRHDYDKHALDAIQEASPFDPLPTGATHALPICMRFGYNTSRDPKPTKPWDYQPPPAKASQP